MDGVPYDPVNHGAAKNLRSEEGKREELAA
jgi:hypothetical protein